jgi:hypothetical protein
MFPDDVERITSFPDTHCSESIIPSEPLVRASDFDKLLALYRELQRTFAESIGSRSWRNQKPSAITDSNQPT